MVDHLQSRVTPWRQYASHVKVRGTLSKMDATAGKISNKSNKRLMRYCTFIFSISCNIASATSYFIEKEAKNLQNGDVYIAQIPDFEVEYLENHLAD